MIQALRIQASVFSGETINAATISIPFLPALYGEDTVDAFEYLSLTNIEFYPFPQYFPIPSVSSFYLRNGAELVPCTADSNRTTCPVEGQPLRESEFTALTVTYTRSSLSVGTAAFTTCYSGYQYGKMSNGNANFELGYDAREDEYGEHAYWEKIKHVLLTTALASASDLTKVIVWGDAAGEPKFLEILREILDEAVECKELEILSDDPVYGGALGSAEFAKRASINPELRGERGVSQEEL